MRLKLLFCLAQFALATYGLGRRSLWGDEAFGVWASKEPLSTYLWGFDSQPFYYLMLKATIPLWGQTPFALRYLSVCCAILFALVMLVLARRIIGKGGQWLTYIYIGASPMTIYYAQEARIYTPACLFLSIAMYFTVCLYTHAYKHKRWLAGYIIFTLFAIFTHTYTVGILAVNALVLLKSSWRTRSKLSSWLLAHGSIAAVYGVWFFNYLPRLISQTTLGRHDFVPSFSSFVNNFMSGIHGLVMGVRADEALAWLSCGVFVLGLLGLWAIWRIGSYRWAVGFILMWAGASLGIAIATSRVVALFSPRYFMFVLLPFALAVGGWGVVLAQALAWRRAVGQMALAVIVGGVAVYGNAPIFDAKWSKSRYDVMLNVIRQQSQVGDGLIMLDSDQHVLYSYYGPVNMPDWLVSNEWLNNNATTLLDDKFSSFTQNLSRIWLINYGSFSVANQRTWVEQKLSTSGVRVYSDGFQDAMLSLYWLAKDKTAQPIEPMPNQIVFALGDDRIALSGVRWAKTSHQYIASEVILFDLLWKTERPPVRNYTLFVHLRTPSDNSRMAGVDAQPVAGTRPTNTWQINEVITDPRGLPIPSNIPSGRYELVIGWYEYPSFSRLTLQNTPNTEYKLAEVYVVQNP
jgi:hypothetical protein